MSVLRILAEWDRPWRGRETETWGGGGGCQGKTGSGGEPAVDENCSNGELRQGYRKKRGGVLADSRELTGNPSRAHIEFHSRITRVPFYQVLLSVVKKETKELTKDTEEE